ncbi:MAG: bifunctional folylpolyglutamate synthase/dihydrofolate synthase [Proteobacteria bacterium]|nr:bifunctional folylpolyglutamate synthase/dihydrofolate synthase [Pseudomonadota bacterium]
MRDFAVSEHAGVQAQLDRLGALSLPKGRLGLEVIHQLLARLGNPQDRLPPVLHVAGTNGKGSTCAFLRAMLEATGLVVHSATKPHLVRYNERIRLAGQLISDDALAELLKEVLDAGEDLEPSFFEVTTAATFLAYARVPADVCVIEVGLGGRYDATNVLKAPAACGIAALGIDHEGFLLVPEDGVPQLPIARIAFEKAGIARANAPLLTQAYPPEAEAEIEAAAARSGAVLAMRGRHWWAEVRDGALHYRDAQGSLTLPLPAMQGPHQADNAALAVAMLRHQGAVKVPEAAMAEGIRTTRWPARLQLLGPGPLTAKLPGRRVLVDGGHNADAAQAVARALAAEAPVALVFGLMANRRVAEVLGPLAPLAGVAHAVPLPGHEHHDPRDIAMLAQTSLGLRECYPAFTLEQALERIAADPAGPRTVLIAGSLYLAGQALRLNEEIPD